MNGPEYPPITEERKKRIDTLYESYSVVAEDAYVYVCDLRHDYSRWNPELVRYFDMPGEYMYNAAGIWSSKIHPDDKSIYDSNLERIFHGNITNCDFVYRVMDRMQRYSVVAVKGTALLDADGMRCYFIGIIKPNRLKNDRDNFTGLRNQYGFFEDLVKIIENKKESNIIMMGISRFGQINEIYGYDFGNRVLLEISKLLRNNVTDNGSLADVYRLDGARFALVTDKFSMDILEKSYNWIQSLLLGDFKVNGRRLSLKLNGGGISVNNFDISDKTVYSCLSYAYHVSKNERKGELVIFKNDLDGTDLQRLEKIDRIRESINSGCKGFELFYQPIMFADSETLKGAEALIRYSDDTHGIVPPDHFIPIIENDRLFPDTLGRWILKTAMEQGKEFLDKYPDFRLNVNLSYAQLERADFADIVLGMLEDTGFPGENLCLEITERCRLVDIRHIKNVMIKLRGKGVFFALDDFGTGFSSMNILKSLPLDTIKIDRGFVINVDKDEKEQKLVSYFTSIASLFGSDVCVEGIETSDMKETVRRFPVNSLQGYYYSKPVSYDIFLKTYCI